MPMPKRKPNYNPTSTMRELLTAVCEYYGDPVDDRKDEDPDHVSLHNVAAEFNITVMKARKLLITGRLYSTAISRRVQELHRLLTVRFRCQFHFDDGIGSFGNRRKFRAWQCRKI